MYVHVTLLGIQETPCFALEYRHLLLIVSLDRLFVPLGILFVIRQQRDFVAMYSGSEYQVSLALLIQMIKCNSD